MIKAVFFDIDGTLVSFKTHGIPESTREAIDALRRQGIKVFVATGRSGLLIDNLELGKFDGVLAYNGQYCRSGSEVIYKHAIPAADVQGAVDYATATGISCLFEGVDFIAINSLNQNTIDSCKLLKLRLPEPGDISRMAEKEIIQLIFFGGREHEEELLAKMPSCLGTRWSPLLADIIPKGGGKHVGMEKVLEHYGIRREDTMAFGDGENDITMLRYAGTGVAMGNASDEVKAAADYVTSSVDDDGIAMALARFGII